MISREKIQIFYSNFMGNGVLQDGTWNIFQDWHVKTSTLRNTLFFHKMHILQYTKLYTIKQAITELSYFTELLITAVHSC